MFQVHEFHGVGKFVLVPIILLLSILVGYIIAIQGLNYRLIMIFGALIIGGIALVLGERGIRAGFMGWIAMFGLGYRTVTFESTYLAESGSVAILRNKVQIHPLVMLIFLLWILIIIQSFGTLRHNTKSILPSILWVFSMFWIWGLLIGGAQGFRIEDMFSDVLNFVIIIPIFLTTQFVLINRQSWKSSLTLFFVTATFIAIMGAIEYSFPQIKSVLPGFIINTVADVDPSGFARAKYSFWGSPIAAFVIVLALPFILPLWKWHTTTRSRFMLTICTCINIYGIYIAGYRSMWAVTMILVIAIGIISKNFKFIVLLIFVFLVLYIITPPQARKRFETFTDSVSGNFNKTVDSSSAKRAHRAQDALSFALQNPLGNGWTASGWVHSDFIQLAADIGLLGAGIFILWYLKTLLALAKQCLKFSDPLMLALFGAFIAIGAQFLFEAVYVLTQLIAPIWFIWAMAEIKLRNSNDKVYELGFQRIEDVV